MVRLRGHHLICLRFFNGEGYDRRFVENLRTVVRDAEAGEIMICGEADDVCSSCPYLKGPVCAYDAEADAAVREMDAMALTLLQEEEGSVVRWERLTERIHDMFPKWYEHQCRKCDWSHVCEQDSAYMRLKG